MKVSVTPHCRHYVEDRGERHLDHFSEGVPVIGQRLMVTPDGAWVDGQPVVLRDRRAKVNREPGHPWTSSNSHPDPRYRRINWTGFSVDVEP